MIKPAKETHLEGIVHTISTSIMQCIDAKECDLHNIITDSISSSSAFFEQEQEGVHPVYIISGRVVGIVLIHDYWNMKNLFVLPEFHNKGVASQLVARALDICKSRNAGGSVKLYSSAYAAAFYEKVGFKQNGEPCGLPGGCIPFTFCF